MEKPTRVALKLLEAVLDVLDLIITIQKRLFPFLQTVSDSFQNDVHSPVECHQMGLPQNRGDRVLGHAFPHCIAQLFRTIVKSGNLTKH